MKKSTILLSILVATLITVGFMGCGDAGGAAKKNSPVMLILKTTEQNQINSSACELDENGDVTSITEEQVSLTATVKLLDPDVTKVSVYSDVIITGYEVRYERTDTGTEVPKAFSGNCSAYCAVNSTVSFPVVFIRADQKLMPPISYLCEFGYEPDTGLTNIHTTCIITVWGHTVSGRQVVSNPAYLSVDFARFWNNQ
jgi:hypothetical protein